MVFTASPQYTWSVIFLSLFASILPLGLIWSIKKLIDVVTVAAETGSYDSTRMAIYLAVAIAVIYFIEESLQSLINIVRKKQSYKVESYMFGLIHSKSISLDLLHFENPKYYDTLSRASREAPYRPSSIVSNITGLLRSGLSLLLMAGLLSFLNIWLLALLIVANIPGIWLRIHFSDILYNFKKELSPTARKAAYFNWLITGDRPSREQRLFGLGEYFSGIFKKHFDQQQTEEIKIIRKRSMIELISGLFKAVAVLVAIWYIVNQAIGSWISLGDLAMYLLAFRMGMTFLKQMLGSLAGLYEDNLFVSDVFEFLNLKEKVVAVEPVVKVGSLSKAIEFEDLCFAYPGTEGNVLCGLNLDLRKGETLALVGANGAGKTTLARLLCRLYDPTDGQIMIDGNDIRNIDPLDYRRMFSVLFQDFMLYNMSAGENIIAGDIKNMDDMARLESAADLAGIKTFIENLPRGYDTVIGRLFDDSRELSWGEWQKIALARALYRQSEILVLDEPASALDAESEYELFTRFKKISAGRTTLLISHRFSNVSIADRIALLENGKISELGTHKELLKLNGHYAKMYGLQKSRFEG